MASASKLPPTPAASTGAPPSGVRRCAPRASPGAPTSAGPDTSAGPTSAGPGTPISADSPPADPSPSHTQTIATRTPLDFDEEFTLFAKAQLERVEEHARRLRVPWHKAEDILQRSLEKLWLHRDVVDRAHWEAWLWQAMRLRSLEDFRRVRRAWEHRTDLTLLLEACQSSTSPEVETYQRECARELLALLGRLTPERREVVCLYLIDDLPMAEVAARLHISENTAKDRWRLACIDMGLDWERGRAREQFSRRIAAFLMAVAGLVAALWHRLTRRIQRHAGPLLASAACALLLSPGEEPVEREALREATTTLSPMETETSGESAISADRSPLEYAFAPRLQPPVEAEAEQEMEAGPRHPPPRAAQQPSDMPHRLLSSAQAELHDGNFAGARAFLNEYIGTYPHDPLSAQHAKLAAALAAH